MLTPEVTERTRAERAASAVLGLVAEQEDHLAGLAHLVLYPTTWATHPTYYLDDPLRRQAVARRDVAHRLIEAFVHSPTGSAPPAFIGSPRSTTSRHAPYTTPLLIGHRSSYTSAEFAEDSARYGRRRRLPEADPLRYAEAEIAVFAGFPRSARPRRSTSLNRRQSRRSSAIKINKEVISKQIQNGRGEG